MGARYTTGVMVVVGLRGGGRKAGIRRLGHTGVGRLRSRRLILVRVVATTTAAAAAVVTVVISTTGGGGAVVRWWLCGRVGVGFMVGGGGPGGGAAGWSVGGVQLLLLGGGVHARGGIDLPRCGVLVRWALTCKNKTKKESMFGYRYLLYVSLNVVGKC